MNPSQPTAEEERLAQARAGTADWRRWGPYLSERQWGTVREDYSPNGTAWDYFPHDHARSRAYRWGEDGIAGICDDQQHLCFSIALWNGADAILKERLFGLTGTEGNHGEDVKEYYFYVDNVPSHAYMKYLYKYPQRAFPYAYLVETNRKRGKLDPEYELLDTGIFAEDRYFDVAVEYAKGGPDDLLVRISATNRGPDAAPVHLLPTLWFRNRWSWFPGAPKPEVRAASRAADAVLIEATHPTLETFWLACAGSPPLLFTENETNTQAVFHVANASPYVKDGIDAYVVHGQTAAVNPQQRGTKIAAQYVLNVAAGQTTTVSLRLSNVQPATPFGAAFDAIFTERKAEADAFYARITPYELSDDMRSVQRQAFAGLLWNKQYYEYDVAQWLDGDPVGPPPPAQRHSGRNAQWRKLWASDVFSMPDKWEYPWFAAWDLGFHAIALAAIDPDFAKRQLVLVTNERYLGNVGAVPAYEWAFGDVNPPVHAWAAMRVYEIERKMYDRADRGFLVTMFHSLLINFTWWVNKKDAEDNNIFEGGFLGLDNIGVFDRTLVAPGGGTLEQADGTSWMTMYCLNLLTIALELAIEDAAYENIAVRFFEEFVRIADAIDAIGGELGGLWNDIAGFYYDVLKMPDGRALTVKADTIAGLVPLYATDTNEPDVRARFLEYRKRFAWFVANNPALVENIADTTRLGVDGRVLLAVVDPDQLRRILEKVLDPEQFLSPFGIRSVSRNHLAHPAVLDVDGAHFQLDYEPAESTSAMFGGNSNWRGPIWFPLNYLLIESLQRFHYYMGDAFKVEYPTGSGNDATLWEVAEDLSRRLIAIFVNDADGRRPVYGGIEKFQNDPHWHDFILFHEYFHGDNGAGLGASAQTGWTGLVAKLILQFGEYGTNKSSDSIEREAAGHA
jgi:hypothetical protein